eukprot:TRINITY_DN7068_c0_g1_i1.p1 TRINITY_DN7068_c0_g1~~TRINITY_DN7068_c0_g1_i1.p1  ORF type:complete len:440 (-),score=82.66 TRINITY_DN7068_c0_g1_i1:1-1320(-)
MLTSLATSVNKVDFNSFYNKRFSWHLTNRCLSVLDIAATLVIDKMGFFSDINKVNYLWIRPEEALEHRDSAIWGVIGQWTMMFSSTHLCHKREAFPLGPKYYADIMIATPLDAPEDVGFANLLNRNIGIEIISQVSKDRGFAKGMIKEGILKNILQFNTQIINVEIFYLKAIKNLVQDEEDILNLLEVEDLVDTLYRNVDVNPRFSAYILALIFPHKKYRDLLIRKGEKSIIETYKTKEFIALRTVKSLREKDDPLVQILIEIASPSTEEMEKLWGGVHPRDLLDDLSNTSVFVSRGIFMALSLVFILLRWTYSAYGAGLFISTMPLLSVFRDILGKSIESIFGLLGMKCTEQILYDHMYYPIHSKDSKLRKWLKFIHCLSFTLFFEIFFLVGAWRFPFVGFSNVILGGYWDIQELEHGDWIDSLSLKYLSFKQSKLRS